MKKRKKRNEETYSELASLVVDLVETEFHIAWQSDDAGHHWNIYVPEDHGVEDLRIKIPAAKAGKRVILTVVPSGYIEVFFGDDRK